jgi:SHS2 domain-containing protein
MRRPASRAAAPLRPQPEIGRRHGRREYHARQMTAAFELFEHTADLGIRVRAATAAELVAPATAGLYATMGVLVAQPANTRREFEFRGGEPAVLLRDYLAELLYLVEEHRCIVTRVTGVELSPDRLYVTAETAPLDSQRSVLAREVKAVTYHDLALRPIPGGVEVEFIVDI